jgi:hypothetical protein
MPETGPSAGRFLPPVRSTGRTGVTRPVAAAHSGGNPPGPLLARFWFRTCCTGPSSPAAGFLDPPSA